MNRNDYNRSTKPAGPALGLLLSVLISGSALAGFDVDTSSAMPVVSYDGVEVISAVELYFTRPGSWKKADELDTCKLRVSQAGGMSRLSQKADTKSGGSYEWEMEWQENRLHMRLRYALEPGAKIGHVINEIYLAWPLVKGATRTGPKGAAKSDEFQTLGPAHTISFETYIGRLDWTLSARVEKPAAGQPPAQWRLRDTRSHTYRPRRCRTHSFISSVNVREAGRARESGLIQELDVTLAITPRPHLDASVLANGLLEALDAAAKRWPNAASTLESDAGWQNLRENLRAVVAGTASGRNGNGVPRLVADAAVKTEAFLKQCLADAVRAKDDVFVIPKPQRMVRREGSFVLGPDAVIVLPKAARKEEGRGANALVEELAQYYGVALPIVRADEAPAGKRCIAIGRGGQTALIRRLCREEAVEITPEKPGPEGYALHVRPDYVLIAGSDDHGAFYGVQSLIQLLRRDDAGRLVAPSVKILDWPQMKLRAMMMMAGRHGAESQKRAIRRIIARYKLNTLLYALGWGDINWTSHPEITKEHAWSRETLQECVDVAREHNLEIVPYLQTAGHSKWLTEKRPDLAEKWSALCLSNPDTFRFVTDVVGEAIEICKPKIFHIACDEVAQIGICDRCRNTPAADLYAGHVTRLHDWLAERGIKTMMWHDMLLSAKDWPNASAHSAMNPEGAYAVATHPAAEKLPRDIIMGVWIYGEHNDYPALRHFQKLGYPVVACPWYKDKNNYFFASCAHKAGALGVVGTTWMFSSHQELSMMSVLTAEYAWTPDVPKLEDLPYRSVERMQYGMFAPRPSSKPHRAVLIDIRPSCNRTLRDPKANDGRGWTDQGPLYDMRLLPEGKNRFGRLAFEIVPAAAGSGRQCIGVGGKDIRRAGLPAEVSGIRLDTRAASLVFLHTASTDTYLYAKPIAEYVVHYADGTEKVVALRTYRNIVASRKPQDYTRPHDEARNSGYILEAERAWVGLNLAGDEIDVQAYEWVNPYPEKTIATLDLRMTDHNQQAAVFLLALTAVQRQNP